jgi:CheY-like chemotaxis protein
VESPIQKRKILVVDDERLIADTLVQILNMMGYEAVCVYNGAEAIQRAAKSQFDMLISDVVMPGMNGIDAAIEICKLIPTCKVLLISGNNRTGDLLREAQSKGYLFEVLAKPVHPREILAKLDAMSPAN